MGFLDKVLTFGNAGKGKIVSWGIVVISTILFFSGILMASLGSTTERINSLNIRSETMENFEYEFNGYMGYHLFAQELKTFITATPSPRTNAPVVFSRGNDPRVRFQRSSIMAGDVAVMELVPGPQGFVFHALNGSEEDLPPVVISVSCGNESKTIYVWIVLIREHVTVSATLQVNYRDPFSGNWLTSWNNTNVLDMKHFLGSEATRDARYRVRLQLIIFGNTSSPVYDTNLRESDYQFFEPLDVDGSDITLWDNEGGVSGDGIFIVDTWAWDIDDNEIIYVSFQISCWYKGTEYFTEPNFRIRLINTYEED